MEKMNYFHEHLTCDLGKGSKGAIGVPSSSQLAPIGSSCYFRCMMGQPPWWRAKGSGPYTLQHPGALGPVFGLYPQVWWQVYCSAVLYDIS